MSPRRYAATTSVSSDRSRLEIETTLRRYGATAFAYGWEGSRASIAFKARDRHIRFVLPLPDRDERRFQMSQRGIRKPDAALALWDQACRSSWRALALVIKAKLEAVEAN